MTRPDYDSGDQYDVQTHGKNVRTQRSSSDEEFVELMADKRFRAFVWELLDLKTGALKISADPSSFELPHYVYFREGQRHVGIDLIDRIYRLCPRQYDVMVAEAKQRSKELNHG